MENPLVSIIIPTYNRAHFLRLTLLSIANQTYQNFEVFVIDDGSPNNEAQLVCENFEKVQYIKKGIVSVQTMHILNRIKISNIRTNTN